MKPSENARVAEHLNTPTDDKKHASKARRLVIRLTNRITKQGLVTGENRKRGLRQAARPVRWYANRVARNAK